MSELGESSATMFTRHLIWNDQRVGNWKAKSLLESSFFEFGSSDWTRTSDIRINSRRSTD